MSSWPHMTGPASWPRTVVEPLYPSKVVLAQFPKYTLDAFSYGTAVKKLYGVPVQIENIGLLVNTKLGEGPDDLLPARE